MMKYILSQTIFAGFVLALYFVAEIARKKGIKYRENKLFMHVGIFSAIWSLGFFGVILQTDPQNAYFWRGIGMVGTFGYLISAQYLICSLSGVKRFYCRLAECFSLLGVILYFFVIRKEQVTYSLGEFGMTYSFQNTLWNNLYIWYTIVVAINQCFIIIYMIKKPKMQRTSVLGKRLLLVEVVIVIGMLLDTVFPMFGKPAIPGSTIGQFAGLAVLYHAILFVNHSRINVANVSEFVYYALHETVMVYDNQRSLQILNRAGAAFLGAEKNELCERAVYEIFSVGADEVFTFENNSISIDTVCIRNGKPCNLAISKIYDECGDKIGYIIIVEDLSERMKTVKQLQDAKQEAEDANKAKSIFLANMSHEIRTPMNAIIGFSELLLKMNIDSEVRSHVLDIKWSSHNLMAIINDILDISKIESGKMELVPSDYYTANLLDDVVLIIGPQAKKKGLQFEVDVSPDIPRRLYGDKVRIRGVLINILNNAVKYTNEGSIKFEVKVLEKIDNRLRIAFCVTDTGVGIKEENLSTLFDSYERLDQKVHYNIEGSGLGLAIAKSYVTLMGGEITVSSKYGEGSVFTVEIDQEIVDEKPIERENITEKEMSAYSKNFGFKVQNVRVLVVDDNPVNLKVANSIMSAYGLETDVVLSGQEAIELCKKRNYDIVFMDQMMEEMDGIQAMQEIRKLNAHYALHGTAKIIVLTANAIKGTREMLMQQGFDEYLGKPLNIERLESLLCQFIPKEKILFESAETGEEVAKQNEELSYMKQVLQGIDVELGIQHCGGGFTDYLKVLEITYKYGEKQLAELRQLWDAKEYKNYNIKVHSLKSTTLNIGACEVSAEARRQEEAGVKENYGYIADNIDRLLVEYQEVLARIREVLIHYEIISESVDDEMDKPKLNERMVLHMLRNIVQYIDDFDFGKIFDVLEEVTKYRVPKEYQQVLARIEELMEELQIDEIREAISEVVQL